MATSRSWRQRLSALWLYAVVLGCLVIWFCSQPPSALPASASPEDFSAHRAKARLEALLGDQPDAPRVVGRENNAAVVERLTAQFHKLGLEAEVQRERVCAYGRCAEVRNVIAYHPSVPKHKRDLVMLSAHHDSVPTGPGVADDLASVAAILEVAATRQASNPMGKGKSGVLYFISDGEEMGLFGAKAFYKHPLADRVKAVVNLEARGTRGRSFIFEATHASGWLLDRAAYGLSAPAVNSLAPAVYERLPNGSDLHVHREHVKPGVNFGFFAEVSHYHTPLDDLSHLSLDSLQHQGQNAAEMVQGLTSHSLRRLPSDRAVYFDLLGRKVVKWPEPWSPRLATVALIFLWLIAVAGHKYRFHAGSSTAMIFGNAFKPLLYLFLSSIVLLALHYGIGEAVHDPFFWRANREAVVWGYGLLTVLMFCGFHAYKSEEVSGHMWFGHWIFFAMMGVVAGILLPAVSYIFIAPCVFAAIVSPFYGRAPRLIGALTAFFGACVWLPLLWALIDGLDLLTSLLVGLPVAFLMLALMPLTSEEGVGKKPGFVFGMLWMIFAAFIFTLSFPSSSQERPVGANVYLVQTEGVEEANLYFRMMPMDMLARSAKGTQKIPEPGEKMPIVPYALRGLANDVYRAGTLPKLSGDAPTLRPLGSLPKDRTQPVERKHGLNAEVILIESKQDAPIITLREASGAKIFWLPTEASVLDNDQLLARLKEYSHEPRSIGECFGWDAPCLEIRPDQPLFIPYGQPLRVIIEKDVSQLDLEIREIFPAVPPAAADRVRGPRETAVHSGDQTLFLWNVRVDPAWYGPM